MAQSVEASILAVGALKSRTAALAARQMTNAYATCVEFSADAARM
jgi:hypothetical protein